MKPRVARSLRLSLLQLCEVLDRTYHLAGVAVLVVVPANYLYLIGILVDLSYHGLGGIEERTELHTDYIARYDLVLGVTEALGLSSLHCCVDTLFGDVFALNNSYQDSGRTRRSRNTLCATDQLAVQLRNNQTDGLSCTGAVRNDVLRTCTATTEITLTLRTIEERICEELLPSERGSWSYKKLRR